MQLPSAEGNGVARPLMPGVNNADLGLAGAALAVESKNLVRLRFF